MKKKMRRKKKKKKKSESCHAGKGRPLELERNFLFAGLLFQGYMRDKMTRRRRKEVKMRVKMKNQARKQEKKWFEKNWDIEKKKNFLMWIY